ncbi:TetR/AcrR family transcriptional regulator [Actinacidiphila acidipaludis]|uniref:TetR/AcrR family transcriptional regulator n=1 Tax=Actinacidiphila acidipaludis TaxID=2873382 RepID=A0ABS7QHI1_9ACTN|nr:TetR/AcrR family transcriptional regulator [Streptomyces acidipaludis]MBY8882636.1 TetR/AcrR family transcriptional regulator [Streptomyces acidipaludis]
MGSEAPAYRRMSVEARRRQLLAAAVDLFGHRRPEDVSVDDVAAAAGVSRPLVYRYFPGGKQQLYEAAVLGAAEELIGRFAVPSEGPPTQRLASALDRYLAYVDEHDAAYGALLRGGSVAETSRTDAIVDDVRRRAAEQVLHHLGVASAGPRLAMMVRSWIASVEAVSLIWLDEGKQPPVSELRDWLVDQFTGLLLVTASTDPEAAEAAARALELETPDSPAGSLARRLVPLAPMVAPLFE